MSQIIATTLSNGSVSVPTATVVNGSAKAWVNFNGTGTIAARDSFNVASLTDNGTGDYTVNFTSSFANANYNHAGMAGDSTSNLINISQNVFSHAPTVSAARYETTFANSSLFDPRFVGATALGDLA